MVSSLRLLRVVSGVFVFGLLSLSSGSVRSQERAYSEGSVWYITMVRVKPGMFDTYMRNVLPVRKKINEELRKQGLVLSDRVMSGLDPGPYDFDVMFMTEFKNWAAFDGLRAKYDAASKSALGSEEKRVQTMTRMGELREIVGIKQMQEIIPK